MELVKVSAISRNFFNLPLWVGQHLGFFRDEGLDVEVEYYEAIDIVHERLRDGHVQFSRGATEHVMLDREQGGHQEIIGGSLNKLPFSLIGGKHIKCFEDLRGGTVGVSSIDAGSSSLIMKIFESHGLTYPDDYQLLACGPILARWEKFKSGEIDAGLQGVPLNHIAIDEGFTDLGDMRALYPDFQFSSLNVDGRWARENRSTVVAFMRAWMKSHEWTFANREAGSQIAVIESGVEQHYATRAWDEYIGGKIFPEDGAVSMPGVQTLIDVSALIRALPKRGEIKAETYVNSAFIEEAAKDLA